MTRIQAPCRSVSLGIVLLLLTLAAGLISPLVNAATSSSENTAAAFEAFTSAPDKAKQQALLQYFSEKTTHPITERTPEFEKMVVDGHPLALEVAFASLGFTDGAESSHLNILIGKSIMSNPEAFLKTLSQYLPTIRRLDSLLGNLGEEYVDNPSATVRGLEHRYLALRDIDSPHHNEARDDALLALSKMIYESREWMKLMSSDPEAHHD